MKTLFPFNHIMLLSICLIAFLSCKKDDKEENKQLPVVETLEITDVFFHSAKSGGSILNDGGHTILQRGVCWSTDILPTIADFKSSDGAGAGQFKSDIAGLEPGVTYYLRAYATNSSGTSYGMTLAFSTISGRKPCPQSPNMTDKDGNIYETVLIGNQCWMAENLGYLPNVNPPSESSQIHPIYYVYGYIGNSIQQAKATDSYERYGVLYNWQAAKTACPEGWRLPNDVDWQILESTVDSLHGIDDPVWGHLSGPYLWPRGFDVGKNLKSQSEWVSKGIGSNISGFNALPGGYRNTNGSFNNRDSYGYWWTSSDVDSLAFNRWLYSNADGSYRDLYNQPHGFSVRCLKN